MNQKKQSRRNFISNIALGTVGTFGASSILASCASSDSFRKLSTDTHLSLLEQAPDGKVLKAGLVGCGGRGTGAAANFLD
ncbi:MAG: hypothetical protein WD625_02255, partial [Balneolales bacterium]